MNYKNIISIFAVLFLFVGCVSTEVAESGDVNQDEIYQSYYAEFDAEDNESFGTAVFRFGGYKGTTLQLTDGSDVELNGKQTRGEKEFLQGMVYRFENLSTMDTKFNFVFTTTDEKEFRNTIKLVPLTPVSPKGKIKNKESNKISWKGEPLDSQESVHVTITDQNGYVYTNATTLKGADFVTVTPDSLAPGLANVQLYRKIERSLDEATNAGGTINGTYYSEIIPVTITE